MNPFKPNAETVWIKSGYSHFAEELKLHATAGDLAGMEGDTILQSIASGAGEKISDDLEQWLKDGIVDLAVAVNIPGETLSTTINSVTVSELVRLYPDHNFTFLLKYKGDPATAPFASKENPGLRLVNQKLLEKIRTKDSDAKKLTAERIEAQMEKIEWMKKFEKEAEEKERIFRENEKLAKQKEQVVKEKEKAVRKIVEDYSQAAREKDKDVKRLEARTAGLEARTAGLQARSNEQDRVIAELRQRAEQVNAWKKNASVSIQALLCRSALDTARTQAYSLLTDNDIDPSRLGFRTLISTICDQLPPSENTPSKAAVELFCGWSDIRERGNVAAHPGNEHDIGEAILSLLPGTHRQLMIQIYKYIFEKEPSLIV